MPCSRLWQCLAALFLAFGVSTTAQELLGASQGFPALGELVGVIADEVKALKLSDLLLQTSHTKLWVSRLPWEALHSAVCRFAVCVLPWEQPYHA